MSKITKRVVAFLTVMIFTLTNHFMFPTHANAQEISSANNVMSMNSPLMTSQIRIPERIGEVVESFVGETDRSVILVQDAHAIPDAQKNIHNIIKFFNSKHGIKTVALEGASGDLDPQIFKSFPEQKLLKEVFKSYYEAGELTGGTGAAIFENSAINFEGIENWQLYQEGLELFQEAMRLEPKLLNKVGDLQNEVSRSKRELYEDSLLQLDLALNAFYGNYGNLMETLSKLAKIQAPEKGSELDILLGEHQRKDLMNIEIEIKEVTRKIEPQIKAKVKRFDAMKFFEFKQKYMTSQITAEAFAFEIEKIAGQYGLNAGFSKELKLLIKKEKSLKDIEGTELFDQFEIYAQETFERAVEDFQPKNQQEEALALHKQGQDLRVIEKLIKLELTVDEYLNIGSNPYIREMIQDGISTHILFYQNARERDQVFFDKIQELFNSSASDAEIRSALLIAGGFHTEGLTKRLKEAGVSYALVMPAIKEFPEEIMYKAHMRGEVSWKDYFEVEEGRVSLYKAFVRGTRDKLVKEWEKNKRRSGIQPKVLFKNWRDQIIRDLSRKGQVDKASKYTRFIDEVISDAPKTTEADKIMMKVNNFIDGLFRLEKQNNMTQDAVAQLLRSTTLPEGAKSGAVNPQATIPWINVGGQNYEVGQTESGLFTAESKIIIPTEAEMNAILDSLSRQERRAEGRRFGDSFLSEETTSILNNVLESKRSESLKTSQKGVDEVRETFRAADFLSQITIGAEIVENFENYTAEAFEFAVRTLIALPEQHSSAAEMYRNRIVIALSRAMYDEDGFILRQGFPIQKTKLKSKFDISKKVTPSMAQQPEAEPSVNPNQAAADEVIAPLKDRNLAIGEQGQKILENLQGAETLEWGKLRLILQALGKALFSEEVIAKLKERAGQLSDGSMTKDNLSKAIAFAENPKFSVSNRPQAIFALSQFASQLSSIPSLMPKTETTRPGSVVVDSAEDIAGAMATILGTGQQTVVRPTYNLTPEGKIEPRQERRVQDGSVLGESFLKRTALMSRLGVEAAQDEFSTTPTGEAESLYDFADRITADQPGELGSVLYLANVWVALRNELDEGRIKPAFKSRVEVAMAGIQKEVIEKSSKEQWLEMIKEVEIPSQRVETLAQDDDVLGESFLKSAALMGRLDVEAAQDEFSTTPTGEAESLYDFADRITADQPGERGSVLYLANVWVALRNELDEGRIKPAFKSRVEVAMAGIQKEVIEKSSKEQWLEMIRVDEIPSKRAEERVGEYVPGRLQAISPTNAILNEVSEAFGVASYLTPAEKTRMILEFMGRANIELEQSNQEESGVTFQNISQISRMTDVSVVRAEKIEGDRYVLEFSGRERSGEARNYEITISRETISEIVEDILNELPIVLSGLGIRSEGLTNAEVGAEILRTLRDGGYELNSLITPDLGVRSVSARLNDAGDITLRWNVRMNGVVRNVEGSLNLGELTRIKRVADATRANNIASQAAVAEAFGFETEAFQQNGESVARDMARTIRNYGMTGVSEDVESVAGVGVRAAEGNTHDVVFYAENNSTDPVFTANLNERQLNTIQTRLSRERNVIRQVLSFKWLSAGWSSMTANISAASSRLATRIKEIISRARTSIDSISGPQLASSLRGAITTDYVATMGAFIGIGLLAPILIVGLGISAWIVWPALIIVGLALFISSGKYGHYYKWGALAALGAAVASLALSSTKETSQPTPTIAPREEGVERQERRAELKRDSAALDGDVVAFKREFIKAELVEKGLWQSDLSEKINQVANGSLALEDAITIHDIPRKSNFKALEGLKNFISGFAVIATPIGLLVGSLLGATVTFQLVALTVTAVIIGVIAMRLIMSAMMNGRYVDQNDDVPENFNPPVLQSDLGTISANLKGATQSTYRPIDLEVVLEEYFNGESVDLDRSNLKRDRANNKALDLALKLGYAEYVESYYEKKLGEDNDFSISLRNTLGEVGQIREIASKQQEEARGFTLNNLTADSHFLNAWLSDVFDKHLLKVLQDQKAREQFIKAFGRNAFDAPNKLLLAANDENSEFREAYESLFPTQTDREDFEGFMIWQELTKLQRDDVKDELWAVFTSNPKVNRPAFQNWANKHLGSQSNYTAGDFLSSEPYDRSSVAASLALKSRKENQSRQEIRLSLADVSEITRIIGEMNLPDSVDVELNTESIETLGESFTQVLINIVKFLADKGVAGEQQDQLFSLLRIQAGERSVNEKNWFDLTPLKDSFEVVPPKYYREERVVGDSGEIRNPLLRNLNPIQAFRPALSATAMMTGLIGETLRNLPPLNFGVLNDNSSKLAESGNESGLGLGLGLGTAGSEASFAGLGASATRNTADLGGFGGFGGAATTFNPDDFSPKNMASRFKLPLIKFEGIKFQFESLKKPVTVDYEDGRLTRRENARLESLGEDVREAHLTEIAETVFNDAINKAIENGHPRQKVEDWYDVQMTLKVIGYKSQSTTFWGKVWNYTKRAAIALVNPFSLFSNKFSFGNTHSVTSEDGKHIRTFLVEAEMQEPQIDLEYWESRLREVAETLEAKNYDFGTIPLVLRAEHRQEAESLEFGTFLNRFAKNAGLDQEQLVELGFYDRIELIQPSAEEIVEGAQGYAEYAAQLNEAGITDPAVIERAWETMNSGKFLELMENSQTEKLEEILKSESFLKSYIEIYNSQPEAVMRATENVPQAEGFFSELVNTFLGNQGLLEALGFWIVTGMIIVLGVAAVGLITKRIQPIGDDSLQPIIADVKLLPEAEMQKLLSISLDLSGGKVYHEKFEIVQPVAQQDTGSPLGMSTFENQATSELVDAVWDSVKRDAGLSEVEQLERVIVLLNEKLTERDEGGAFVIPANSPARIEIPAVIDLLESLKSMKVQSHSDDFQADTDSLFVSNVEVREPGSLMTLIGRGLVELRSWQISTVESLKQRSPSVALNLFGTRIGVGISLVAGAILALLGVIGIALSGAVVAAVVTAPALIGYTISLIQALRMNPDERIQKANPGWRTVGNNDDRKEIRQDVSPIEVEVVRGAVKSLEGNRGVLDLLTEAGQTEENAREILDGINRFAGEMIKQDYYFSEEFFRDFKNRDWSEVSLREMAENLPENEELIEDLLADPSFNQTLEYLPMSPEEIQSIIQQWNAESYQTISQTMPSFSEIYFEVGQKTAEIGPMKEAIDAVPGFAEIALAVVLFIAVVLFAVFFIRAVVMQSNANLQMAPSDPNLRFLDGGGAFEIEKVLAGVRMQGLISNAFDQVMVSGVVETPVTEAERANAEILLSVLGLTAPISSTSGIIAQWSISGARFDESASGEFAAQTGTQFLESQLLTLEHLLNVENLTPEYIRGRARSLRNVLETVYPEHQPAVQRLASDLDQLATRLEDSPVRSETRLNAVEWQMLEGLNEYLSSIQNTLEYIPTLLLILAVANNDIEILNKSAVDESLADSLFPDVQNQVNPAVFENVLNNRDQARDLITQSGKSDYNKTLNNLSLVTIGAVQYLEFNRQVSIRGGGINVYSQGQAAELGHEFDGTLKSIAADMVRNGFDLNAGRIPVIDMMLSNGGESVVRRTYGQSQAGVRLIVEESATGLPTWRVVSRSFANEPTADGESIVSVAKDEVIREGEFIIPRDAAGIALGVSTWLDLVKDGPDYTGLTTRVEMEKASEAQRKDLVQQASDLLEEIELLGESDFDELVKNIRAAAWALEENRNLSEIEDDFDWSAALKRLSEYAPRSETRLLNRRNFPTLASKLPGARREALKDLRSIESFTADEISQITEAQILEKEKEIWNTRTAVQKKMRDSQVNYFGEYKETVPDTKVSAYAALEAKSLTKVEVEFLNLLKAYESKPENGKVRLQQRTRELEFIYGDIQAGIERSERRSESRSLTVEEFAENNRSAIEAGIIKAEDYVEAENDERMRTPDAEAEETQYVLDLFLMEPLTEKEQIELLNFEGVENMSVLLGEGELSKNFMEALPSSLKRLDLRGVYVDEGALLGLANLTGLEELLVNEKTNFRTEDLASLLNESSSLLHITLDNVLIDDFSPLRNSASVETLSMSQGISYFRGIPYGGLTPEQFVSLLPQKLKELNIPEYLFNELVPFIEKSADGESGFVISGQDGRWTLKSAFRNAPAKFAPFVQMLEANVGDGLPADFKAGQYVSFTNEGDVLLELPTTNSEEISRLQGLEQVRHMDLRYKWLKEGLLASLPEGLESLYFGEVGDLPEGEAWTELNRFTSLKKVHFKNTEGIEGNFEQTTDGTGFEIDGLDGRWQPRQERRAQEAFVEEMIAMLPVGEEAMDSLLWEEAKVEDNAENRKKVQESIEATRELLGRFMELLSASGIPNEGKEKVQKAIRVLFEKQSNALRKTAELYPIHPLEVALTFLEEYGIEDADFIVSAILHDFMEDVEGYEDGVFVKEEFGEVVYTNVASLTNKPLPPAEQERLEAYVKSKTGLDLTEEGKAPLDVVLGQIVYQIGVLGKITSRSETLLLKSADFNTNALRLGNLSDKPALQSRLSSKYLVLIQVFQEEFEGLASAEDTKEASANTVLTAALRQKIKEYEAASEEVQEWAKAWEHYALYQTVMTAITQEFGGLREFANSLRSENRKSSADIQKEQFKVETIVALAGELKAAGLEFVVTEGSENHPKMVLNVSDVIAQTGNASQTAAAITKLFSALYEASAEVQTAAVEADNVFGSDGVAVMTYVENALASLFGDANRAQVNTDIALAIPLSVELAGALKSNELVKTIHVSGDIQSDYKTTDLGDGKFVVQIGKVSEGLGLAMENGQASVSGAILEDMLQIDLTDAEDMSPQDRAVMMHFVVMATLAASIAKSNNPNATAAELKADIAKLLFQLDDAQKLQSLEVRDGKLVIHGDKFLQDLATQFRSEERVKASA